MKRRGLVMGTLILGAGGIVAKLIGFFFRIPLINMIGEEGIGLYQLTYPLYTFLLSIAAGIPTAISKMIAERLAINRRKEAFQIFKAALFIMAIFGGISSVCLILFSNTIIHALNWNKGAYYSLIGIGLAPLFTCILSAYKGYYQGLQDMAIPASSQVIEQFARILVGVGLAWLLLPRGIGIAAGGASFGAAAGSIAGIAWMLLHYRRRSLLFQPNEISQSTARLSAEIIKVSIPVSLGQAIGSIMALLDSVMVPSLLKAAGYSDQLATQMYGQLTGKAFVLVNIPLTLSIALAQSIVPAISESRALKDRARLERNVRMAYKMAMILALPCAAGLYALARPILMLLFGSNGAGWELMQLLAIASVFIIIAQTSTGILNGCGKMLFPVAAIVTGAAVKISINVLYIPDPALNIKAAAIGTLASYVLVAFLDFIFVLLFTKMKMNLYEMFVSPAICTAIMIPCTIVTYSRILLLTGSNAQAVAAAILSSAVVYCSLLAITGTLSVKEIKGMLGK